MTPPARSGPRSTLWFGSGRQAMFALYTVLRGAGLRTVWLPEYHCLSMVSPCTAAGLDVRFYELGPELAPRAATLAGVRETDVVVAAHFFGRAQPIADIAELCRTRGATLLEDAAHVDLSAAAARRDVGVLGDFVLSCPRKFYAIYDGATLTGNAATLRAVERRTPRVREQLKGAAASLFPAKEPVGVARESLPGTSNDTRYVDPRFIVDAGTRATAAARIVWSLTLDKPRRHAVRLSRYRAIEDAITGASFIRPLLATTPESSFVPYAYPAVLANPDDFLRMRRLGINVLRWEELASQPSPTIAALQWSLVQLPCSERIADDVFERMLARLRAPGTWR